MTWVKRWRRRFVGLFLGLSSGFIAAGAPPWPDSVYSYFSESARLETVLAEFAASFNLSLAVQPGVTGTVSGRFTSATPTEFLSRLGGVYGFIWYTQAGVLHVSRASDIVMRSIPVPAKGMASLRGTLTDLGVVEPRFGWGELPEHGVLMVSGPATYVSLIEETLRQLPTGGAGVRQIRVFRLHHASAEDRSIVYRDQKIVQPGLATVLRAMLSGTGEVSVGDGDKAADRAAPVAAAPTLGASSPAQAARAPVRPSSASRGGGQGPSIQADPRLNALIIIDAPEMMANYEQLIAQLDVPSALIEIEAMIIDVNTDKAREMGINWSLRSGGSSASFSGSEIAIGAVSGAAGGATLPSGAGDQLFAQIRMLEKSGDARIQSRPSVLTTDNVGALLDLSETFYIRVQGERVASVSPITSGTTLKVTPRLLKGEIPSIQLTVDIEDGRIQDRQIDSLPTVRRSTVSTQAVVRQSETLMIAGYSSDEAIEVEQKVPLLGDLPGLGVLFSTKARSVQKRERVFLIRPKLVLPGLAAPTGELP